MSQVDFGVHQICFANPYVFRGGGRDGADRSKRAVFSQTVGSWCILRRNALSGHWCPLPGNRCFAGWRCAAYQATMGREPCAKSLILGTQCGLCVILFAHLVVGKDYTLGLFVGRTGTGSS